MFRYKMHFAMKAYAEETTQIDYIQTTFCGHYRQNRAEDRKL